MASWCSRVVGVNSTLYVATLTRQVIRQANERAQLVRVTSFSQPKTSVARQRGPARADLSDLRRKKT